MEGAHLCAAVVMNFVGIFFNQVEVVVFLQADHNEGKGWFDHQLITHGGHRDKTASFGLTQSPPHWVVLHGPNDAPIRASLLDRPPPAPMATDNDSSRQIPKTAKTKQSKGAAPTRASARLVQRKADPQKLLVEEVLASIALPNAERSRPAQRRLSTRATDAPSRSARYQCPACDRSFQYSGHALAHLADKHEGQNEHWRAFMHQHDLQDCGDGCRVTGRFSSIDVRQAHGGLGRKHQDCPLQAGLRIICTASNALCQAAKTLLPQLSNETKGDTPLDLLQAKIRAFVEQVAVDNKHAAWEVIINMLQHGPAEATTTTTGRKDALFSEEPTHTPPTPETTRDLGPRTSIGPYAALLGTAACTARHTR